MSIKTNTLINIIKSLFGVLFPLITFKYASAILGPEGIGTANYVQSVISYFQLFAVFGITTYAVSEGAKRRENRKQFAGFANEMFSFNLLTTAVAYFIIIVLASIGLFGVHEKLILVFSLTLIFTTIGVEWLFTIYEQFLYITLRSFVFQILSLVALFCFVRTENDLLIYILLIALSSVGSNIFNYFRSRSIIRFRFVSLKRLKKHFVPLLILFGTSIASLIYVNSDIIILEILQDDYTVGVYSAAVKIVKVVCVPIASVGIVVLPQIAESVNQLNNDRVLELCFKVISFMSFFIYPFIVGLFMLCDESILLISGQEYLGASLAIKIMTIDIFLSPINGFLVSQLLVPLGKQHISLLATLGGAVINVILDILIIPYYSLNGAAFATVMSELVVFLICIPALKKEINLRSLLCNQWQFAVGSLLIIPIVYLSKQLFDHYLIYVFISIVASFIAYFSLLVLIKNNVSIEICNILKSIIKI